MYIFMCIGELAVILVLRCTQEVDVTLDPSHVYECGLEDQSGKEETTQLTIAVLMVRRINILTDMLDILLYYPHYFFCSFLFEITTFNWAV